VECGSEREWKDWENKWWRVSARGPAYGTVGSDEWISESSGRRVVGGRNSFTGEKGDRYWLKMVWTSRMKRDGDIEGLRDKEWSWMGGGEGERSTPLGESFRDASRG